MLFGAVVDLDPDAQAAYLDAHCSDPAVRADVEGLLARVHLPQAAFDSSKAGANASLDARQTVPGVSPGDFIGPYCIERELGQGGMGTVYLATRADGSYKQRVAVKVLALATFLGLATAALDDAWAYSFERGPFNRGFFLSVGATFGLGR